MALPALPSPGPRPGAVLTTMEKAAVIYRLLEAEGAAPPIDTFDPPERAALEAAMTATMGLDDAAVRTVVDEFIVRLRSAPDGPTPNPPAEPLVESLLPDLGLPDIAPIGPDGPAPSGADPDPWAPVLEQEDEALVAILMAEAPEVSAVLLSKLKVSHAAGLLGQVPGPLARRIAYAVSRTSAISPQVVALIGSALGAALSAPTPRAFEGGPVERVGAILNSSRSATRKEVLSGLDETDPEFAEAVRRAIFTFANIPSRVDKRDVPKIVRRIDPPVLVTAIAATAGDAELSKSADFLLEALPQRMRDTIRGEIEELGDVREDAGEDAMAELVGTIRAMEEAGEIYLVANEDG